MGITRESFHQVTEMVDEAKRHVHDAIGDKDGESRRKKIELAEGTLRRLESLLEEAEA